MGRKHKNRKSRKQAKYGRESEPNPQWLELLRYMQHGTRLENEAAQEQRQTPRPFRDRRGRMR